MKSLTIGTKLRAGVATLSVATLMLGLSSGLAMRSMNESFEAAVQKTARKLQLAESIDTTKSDLSVFARGATLGSVTHDSGLMKAQERQFDAAAAKMKATLAEMDPMLTLPEAKRLFLIVQTDVDKWLVADQEIMRLMDAGKGAQANQYGMATVPPIYREVADASGKLVALYQDELAHDASDAAAQYRRNFLIAGVTLALFLLAAGWIFRETTQIVSGLRRVVTELASGADQVAAAASQIASGSQTLSQGASEQASSVEEISASMEEMTAMTRTSGENLADAMTMMNQTAAQVERSNTALSEMVESMNSIKSSSERVAKINKTIDEIAFQTNILALNAAVEAARAGEAGKGFAVVADEVRNLAQRAAAAAKDTASLIEESIANSNQGAHKLELVSESIRGITDGAQKVKQLVGEVNEAGKQQVQGVQQVSTAMQQVSTVTQSNASSAEESAAAAEELDGQSMIVRELVDKLRQMVDGGQEQLAPR